LNRLPGRLAVYHPVSRGVKPFLAEVSEDCAPAQAVVSGHASWYNSPVSTGSGLIETLWAGFSTIHRRPALMFIPVAVNLLLWLGPRITAQPVATAAGEAVARWMAAVANDPALASQAEQARLAGEELPQRISALGNANLVSLVGFGGWTVPGLVVINQDLGQAVIALGGMPLVGAVLGLGLLGLFLGALFYQLAAQAVRGEPWQLEVALRGTPCFVGRMLGWLGMLVTTSIVVGLPVVIISSLLTLISPTLGLAIILLVWALGLVAGWWLFFHTSAMFVSDLGPLRALLASIEVVARYRAASLLFVLVVWLLSAGWAVVWASIEGWPVGTLLSILGQTYLGCGLVLATMIFYRDRRATLAPPVRAHTPPATPTEEQRGW
jgi:hypothetical protein